jgi:hypothetical protein
MSQWKRNTLFTVAMVACAVAAVLLATLTSASAAGVRAGTSMHTMRQAYPQAEPIPDEGTLSSTQIFKDITQRFAFANPCTGAPGDGHHDL